MKRLALALVVLLAGCEGGWHPLDCALGNSYSSDWCPSGTLGYKNEQAGRGVRLNPAAIGILLQSQQRQQFLQQQNMIDLENNLANGRPTYQRSLICNPTGLNTGLVHNCVVNEAYDGEAMRFGHLASAPNVKSMAV